MVVLDNRDTNNLQTAVRDFFKPAERCDLLDGVYLQNVQLPIRTDTVIEHKLGRQPIGWIVCDKNYSYWVRRIAWDDKTITLYSSNTLMVGGSTMTVSLWVF